MTHTPENPTPTRTALPVLGITGGIGAGKTLVAQALAKAGCAVIDADKVGHDVLADSDVQAALRDRFGPAIFSANAIDRPVLGAMVFADPAARQSLESIVHPRMRALFQQQIAAHRQAASVPAIVLDAAVLFEAGWDDLCTHTAFVDATFENRLQRVHESRGWSREELLAREQAQIPLDSKAKRCCYTLVSSSEPSGVSHLQQQARQLLRQIACR